MQLDTLIWRELKRRPQTVPEIIPRLEKTHHIKVTQANIDHYIRMLLKRHLISELALEGRWTKRLFYLPGDDARAQARKKELEADSPNRVILDCLESGPKVSPEFAAVLGCAPADLAVCPAIFSKYTSSLLRSGEIKSLPVVMGEGRPSQLYYLPGDAGRAMVRKERLESAYRLILASPELNEQRQQTLLFERYANRIHAFGERHKAEILSCLRTDGYLETYIRLKKSSLVAIAKAARFSTDAVTDEAIIAVAVAYFSGRRGDPNRTLCEWGVPRMLRVPLLKMLELERQAHP